MKFRTIITILTLCLTGCLQWAARAVNKIPEETALQKKYDFDGNVIIVGAGAAGMRKY